MHNIWHDPHRKKTSLTTHGHTDSQSLAQNTVRQSYFCLIEDGFTHEIDGRQKEPSQIKTLLLIGKQYSQLLFAAKSSSL